MAADPPLKRLLAASTAILACCFGWAAWLTFTKPALPVSGASALLDLIVAIIVMQVGRSPGARTERPAFLLTAATLGFAALRFFPFALNQSSHLMEGLSSTAAALLLAAAATQRLRGPRGRQPGAQR